MSQRIVCDNCDWTGTANQLDEPSHFWDRLSPGSIVPHGDCPKCGAFCYADEDPIQTELVDVLSELQAWATDVFGPEGSLIAPDHIISRARAAIEKARKAS